MYQRRIAECVSAYACSNLASITSGVHARMKVYTSDLPQDCVCLCTLRFRTRPWKTAYIHAHTYLHDKLCHTGQLNVNKQIIAVSLFIYSLQFHKTTEQGQYQ